MKKASKKEEIQTRRVVSDWQGRVRTKEQGDSLATFVPLHKGGDDALKNGRREEPQGMQEVKDLRLVVEGSSIIWISGRHSIEGAIS